MIHAEITMRSAVLLMDVKVDVLLPEDRQKTTDTRGVKYPVLYILHGMKEDNSSWLQLSNIHLLCRDLPLIVVFPAANNSCYTDMANGKNYYTYISEELPMKLKNYLPITDDPAQTFIMGESMGGYGTMRLALGKPDRYGKAVCLSGGNLLDYRSQDNAVFTAAFGSAEEMKKSDNNLSNLIVKLKDKPDPKPEFMFYCGTEDRAYAGCVKLAEELAASDPALKVGQQYWPGQHNFFFWNQAIPKALAFFGFDVAQNSII